MVNNVQLTPLEALGVAIKAEIEAADWNHPVEWKPRAGPALSWAEGPPTV